MATCTAPGHPSCTITCSNGCGAYFSEKQGCVTKCYTNLVSPFVIGEDEVFSLQLSEVPANGLAKLFGDAIPARLLANGERSSASLTFSLTNVTRKELVEAIEKYISV